MYKRCRMIYHLENGNTIQDIKEFYYRDSKRMLDRVVASVKQKRNIVAIDAKGALISILCKKIVRVEINHLEA